MSLLLHRYYFYTALAQSHRPEEAICGFYEKCEPGSILVSGLCKKFGKD